MAKSSCTTKMDVINSKSQLFTFVITICQRNERTKQNYSNLFHKIRRAYTCMSTLHFDL